VTEGGLAGSGQLSAVSFQRSAFSGQQRRCHGKWTAAIPHPLLSFWAKRRICSRSGPP